MVVDQGLDAQRLVSLNSRYLKSKMLKLEMKKGL